MSEYVRFDSIEEFNELKRKADLWDKVKEIAGRPTCGTGPCPLFISQGVLVTCSADVNRDCPFNMVANALEGVKDGHT